MSNTTTRRRFFATAGGTLAAVVFAGLRQRAESGEELPHLTADDPAAKALGYSEDASKVDAATFAARQAQQACVNCNFYAGKPDGFGPCQLFPGKAVAATGWCSGWAKET